MHFNTPILIISDKQTHHDVILVVIFDEDSPGHCRRASIADGACSPATRTTARAG